MANPPFAGDVKETRILAKYELARTVSLDKVNNVDPKDKNVEDATKRTPTFPEFLRVNHETIFKMADGTYRKVKTKHQNTVGRDILFIERNLNFIKPGGRMAIVLPQGRFNNSSDKDIREYLADHCRILAVVGLHGNVFKPHTGTKTSVLFVQKWDEELCPQVDDYAIFFATMREPSKDNSWDKIYVKHQDLVDWAKASSAAVSAAKIAGKANQQPAKIASSVVAHYDVTPKDNAEFVLDEHEHLVVKHDLFSHTLKDGRRTPPGIAEAFIEFAKKEKLSFFR